MENSCKVRPERFDGPQLSRRAALRTLALTSGIGICGLSFAKEPSTVRIVLQTQLRILDPVTTPAYSTRNHGYMVYDTLFAMDSNSQPKPQMVDTWEASPDGRHYKFTLRSGLRFHDDSPVTAEDVVASLKRWAQRDQMGARLLAATEEIAAIGPIAFTIKLNKPYGLVIETLAKQGSPVPFIMPARIAAAPPSKALTEVIGSGPYRFISDDFQPAVKATYVRFEKYVPRNEPASGFAGAKVAIADRIELVSIPDSQTAIHALQKGEVDFIEDVPPDLVSQLTNRQGITVEPFSEGRNTDMFTLRFNWLQPPFNDVTVRKAALAALYQPDYLEAQFGDPKFYQVCGAVLSCASPYASQFGATQIKPPDIAHARKLLKDSGYSGAKAVILHPTDIQVLSAQASITSQALKKIGMNVEIQSMDYTTMQSRRTKKDPVEKGGWSIFHSQWSALDLLKPVINPNLDGRGESGYPGWSKSEKLEALRDQFAAAASENEKQRIADTVQRLNYEEVVYVPLGGFTKFKGYNQKMRNMVHAPLPLFWQG